MLNGGYSWRLFFYVELAFALALLITAFFIVEETTYHRETPESLDLSSGANSPSREEKPTVSTEERPARVIPKRKTFLQTLKFWGVWEKDSEFFMMMARSFTYFLVPHVLWVVTTYGMFPETKCPSTSANARTRHQHRPRRSDLQLYLPDQDHAAAI
jgi:hypothetical protein